MGYEKQTWATGDVITAEKLNHIEDGIKNTGAIIPTHEATDTDGYTNDVYKLYIEIGIDATELQVCFVTEDEMTRLRAGDTDIRLDVMSATDPYTVIGYCKPTFIIPTTFNAPSTTSTAGSYLANDCDGVLAQFVGTSSGSPLPAMQRVAVLPNTARYRIVSMQGDTIMTNSYNINQRYSDQYAMLAK